MEEERDQKATIQSVEIPKDEEFLEDEKNSDDSASSEEEMIESGDEDNQMESDDDDDEILEDGDGTETKRVFMPGIRELKKGEILEPDESCYMMREVFGLNSASCLSFDYMQHVGLKISNVPFGLYP